MLDITREQILSLNDAAKMLPVARNGKKPHIATLYRWASRGFRGTRLETCRVGRTRFTSIEALERFIRSINEDDSVSSQSIAPNRPMDEGLRRELESSGW
jgi:uncharacterized protein DUF1580